MTHYAYRTADQLAIHTSDHSTVVERKPCIITSLLALALACHNIPFTLTCLLKSLYKRAKGKGNVTTASTPSEQPITAPLENAPTGICAGPLTPCTAV